MKKRLLTFMLVCLLGLSGCGGENSPADSQPPAPDSSAAEVPTEGVPATTPKESLSQRLEREIDAAYAAEGELPENQSTLGMCDLRDKYVARWKQVAEDYYARLMAYNGIEEETDGFSTSEEFHQALSAMHANWAQFYAVDKEAYGQALKGIYGGGSIIGPILGDHLYEKQKAWALQLVGLYEQLGLEE